MHPSPTRPTDTANERGAPGIWSLTSGWRGLYVAAIGAMAVGILLAFAVPEITRLVIDGFREGPSGVTFKAPAELERALALFGLGADTSTALWSCAIATLVVTALAGACLYLRGRWAATASEAIMRRLRDRLHRHLSALPMSFFDGAETGDLVQRCTSDVETVRVFLAAQVVELARSGLLLICVTPLLFRLDADLAWVTLALMPVVVAYSLFFFGRITRTFKAVDEAEGRLTTVLQENLTGIRVVRSFGRSDHERAKFAAANDEHRDRTWELMRVLSVFWSCSDVICFAQGGLVLFFGALWTIQGHLTLGTLVAFTMYSGMVIWPVRQMGRTLIDAGKARVALGRLAEILGAEEEDHLDRTEVPATGPASTAAPRLSGAISIEGLTFRYPEATALTGTSGEGGEPKAGPRPEPRPKAQREHVLEGIDLELGAGQTLALIGPPGAGKSTIVQLLLRLYDYDGEGCSGSIRLDGIELSDLPRDLLRSQVGVVMQSPFLYAKTIETNLRVGRSGAAEDELHAAAGAAAIHDSITGFEEGYRTLLGERGVTLSGGQKQRLAIARALLKEAPILVLDDALSAVDMGTERAILDALEERRGRHTTILIAHRLSVVTQADLILVLDEGRVAERGTHAELLAAGGNYARLWKIQNAYADELAEHVLPGEPEGPLSHANLGVES